MLQQSLLAVACRSCLLDLFDVLPGPLRGPQSRCDGLRQTGPLFGPIVRLDSALLVVATNSSEPRFGRRGIALRLSERFVGDCQC